MAEQKDKEQDGVLLKEIAWMIHDNYGEMPINEQARKVLAKAREAVKGAGLKPDEIKEALNEMLSVPDKDLPTAYEVVAEAANKAALKALGG